MSRLGVLLGCSLIMLLVIAGCGSQQTVTFAQPPSVISQTSIASESTQPSGVESLSVTTSQSTNNQAALITSVRQQERLAYQAAKKTRRHGAYLTGPALITAIATQQPGLKNLLSSTDIASYPEIGLGNTAGDYFQATTIVGTTTVSVIHTANH